MKKGPMVHITYGKEAAIYALRSKRLDIPDEFLDGITKAFLNGAGVKYQDESADNYNVGCCGSNNGILRKIENRINRHRRL